MRLGLRGVIGLLALSASTAAADWMRDRVRGLNGHAPPSEDQRPTPPVDSEDRA